MVGAPTPMRSRVHSPEELEQLDSTTTVFFLRERDLPRIQEFEDSIARAWTRTPIEVVPFSRREAYFGKPGYSLFIVGDFYKQASSYTERTTRSGHTIRTSGVSVEATHMYLDLALPNPNDDEEYLALASIALHPDWDTMEIVGNAELLYQEGYFRNWSPAMLTLYLRAAQKDLESLQRRSYLDDVSQGALLRKLRKQRLYVPQHVLVWFHPYRGTEWDWLSTQDLFQDYPYPIEVVSKDRLRKLLREADEPVFVLDYVKSSSTTFLTILSSTGHIAYRHSRAYSYNLSSSDFAEIAEAIAEDQ